jgi:phage/plasmid-associated DNA primase
MFPKRSVGTMTKSKEGTFGYASLYQKRLVIAPDIPENFQQILDQTEFQSMVTGEMVSIAIKHKNAIVDRDWEAPMAWAGNHHPKDYTNNAGSVSRRIVVIPFETPVAKKNTKLKQEIIETEIVTVMIRCIHKYRKHVEYLGPDTLWSHAPQALLDAQTETKIETNPLAAFLANGDNYYQIAYEEGEHLPLEKLSKAYQNHMKFTHETIVKGFPKDHKPIKDAGFEKIYRNMCKTCGEKASAAECGAHYFGGKNRVKQVFIKNMSIVKVNSLPNYSTYHSWNA